MPGLMPALAPFEPPLSRRETPLQKHPRSLIIIAALLTGVTWLTTVLRVYTRVKMLRTFGSDDITMLLTNVFYTVFAAAAIVDVNLALEPSFMTFKPSVLSDAVNYLIAAEIFYILTIIFFKISLGLFFLRIIKAFWQRYVVYCAVILSTLFGVAYFFFAVFQCGVPRSGLDFAIKKLTMQCVDTRVISGMGYAHAAVVSATDWIFAILPIPLLKGSRMPNRDKFTVGFILILATIGGACSLVRIAYLNQIGATFLNFFDFALWSILEPGIGMIANNLATLRPILRKTLERFTINNSPLASKGTNGISTITTDQRQLSIRSSMSDTLSVHTGRLQSSPRQEGYSPREQSRAAIRIVHL